MASEALTSFTVDKALAAAGRPAELFRDLSAQFWDQPHIPVSVLELCRLDLAQCHRAEAELAVRHPAAGLSDEKIRSLLSARWTKDPAFAAGEKAALHFAEYYYVDPQSISDETAAAVVEHYGESGLVCLVEALGFIDARIRLALMFQA